MKSKILISFMVAVGIIALGMTAYAGTSNVVYDPTNSSQQIFTFYESATADSDLNYEPPISLTSLFSADLPIGYVQFNETYGGQPSTDLSDYIVLSYSGTPGTTAPPYANTVTLYSVAFNGQIGWSPGANDVLLLPIIYEVEDGVLDVPNTFTLKDAKTGNWTDTYIVYSDTTQQVPEPATLLLLGLGLVGVAGARRKFKN